MLQLADEVHDDAVGEPQVNYISVPEDEGLQVVKPMVGLHEHQRLYIKPPGSI